MALFLFWLPFEDLDPGWMVGLAALGLAWLLARWLLGVEGPSWWGWAWRGALVGAALPMGVVALTAFKAGIHAHGFADLTLSQITIVFGWWPCWIGGGAVLGLGLGLMVDREMSR